MQPAPNLAPYAQAITLKLSGKACRVHYYAAGHASTPMPTLILIHGLQDEADTWRHVFEPLAQRYRVIALDLPGFGRSDKSRRAYHMAFYVDAVLALMDALKIGYAMLVGNSLGGMIAETLALKHPARVSRLVLLDGTIALAAPPRGAGLAGFLLRTLLLPITDRRYFARLRKDAQAAYATLAPYYADLARLPQADQEFLFQRVNERVWDEPQRLAALSVQQGIPFFFAGEGRKLAGQIARLPVPTQVIWGEHDHILSIANGRARAALQPGATFHMVAGAGHLPHQEKPLDVLAALDS